MSHVFGYLFCQGCLLALSYFAWQRATRQMTHVTGKLTYAFYRILCEAIADVWVSGMTAGIFLGLVIMLIFNHWI